jgi:hypothetical protein
MDGFQGNASQPQRNAEPQEPISVPEDAVLRGLPGGEQCGAGVAIGADLVSRFCMGEGGPIGPCLTLDQVFWALSSPFPAIPSLTLHVTPSP